MTRSTTRPHVEPDGLPGWAARLAALGATATVGAAVGWWREVIRARPARLAELLIRAEGRIGQLEDQLAVARAELREARRG